MSVREAWIHWAKLPATDPATPPGLRALADHLDVTFSLLLRRSAARVTAGQYLEIMASQNSGSGMALTDSGASMCRLVAIWKEY
jgi:hypothetical protein